MIRDLAKKLATFGESVNKVIVEAEFRRGTFAADAEVLKSHSAMTLVRASSTDAELLVKMIAPRCEIREAVGCRIQSAEKIWRVFTASEVSNFVVDVGDQNKIHRFNPPIVPGLLILETLLAREKFSSSQSLKLRFKNFITAGEPLTLTGDNTRFEISSAGVKKILITLTNKNDRP